MVTCSQHRREQGVSPASKPMQLSPMQAPLLHSVTRHVSTHGPAPSRHAPLHHHTLNNSAHKRLTVHTNGSHASVNLAAQLTTLSSLAELMRFAVRCIAGPHPQDPTHTSSTDTPPKKPSNTTPDPKHTPTQKTCTHTHTAQSGCNHHIGEPFCSLNQA
jgi:hypothetical protein